MSHSDINVKGTVRARSLEFQRAASSLQEGLRRIGNGCAEVRKIRVYFFLRDGGAFGQHFIGLDSSLQPMSRKQFLKLAYDLTKDSNVPHRFNKEISLQGCFVSS